MYDTVGSVVSWRKKLAEGIRRNGAMSHRVTMYAAVTESVSAAWTGRIKSFVLKMALAFLDVCQGVCPATNVLYARWPLDYVATRVALQSSGAG